LMAPYPEWQRELIREYARTWRKDNPNGTRQQMLRDIKQSGVADKYEYVPALIPSPQRIVVPVPPLPDDFRLVPPYRPLTLPPEIACPTLGLIPAPLPPARP
jgi:hypothetical protein